MTSKHDRIRLSMGKHLMRCIIALIRRGLLKGDPEDKKQAT